MATVYRCDRCRLVYETSEELTDVVIPMSKAVDAKTPDNAGQNVGLCRSCMADVHAFVIAKPA